MLDQQLQEYAKTDYYPFHMPGHKRQTSMQVDPYQIDITEIEGFDNLHQPSRAILEAMEQLQQLYHSKKSFLLVNGSTAGNLAAVFAATEQGDDIIIGRNCHKSIYHAAELRQLKIRYTHPLVSERGIIRKTPLSEYERAITQCPQARAVVVTSPTYEGMLEDLDEIVSLAHKNDMVVIVDAAHGAHLGFHEAMPPSPLSAGADIVIMSLHKTLPALTQTAVLHMHPNTNILERRIQKYLSMFQTSSPSYVLMASICQCIRFLETGEAAFAAYIDRLDRFYAKCEALRYLQVKQEKNQDKGKIIIDTGRTNITGYELQKRLHDKYHIELEMASFYYGLAMTSVMDTEDGFLRLFTALQEIDATCTHCNREHFDVSDIYIEDGKRMELYEAARRMNALCRMTKASGEVAAEMVSIYPPAIPLVVPGEVITERKMEMIQNARRQGLHVTGLHPMKNEETGILVVVN